MRLLNLFVSAPSRSLEDRLIEEESKIGGTIFATNSTPAQSRRFWYSGGDWFFEQQIENNGYQVIRYQIFENTTHKLINGREYPFVQGEKEILLEAIKRYNIVVSEKLYGVSSSSALAV